MPSASAYSSTGANRTGGKELGSSGERHKSDPGKPIRFQKSGSDAADSERAAKAREKKGRREALVGGEEHFGKDLPRLVDPVRTRLKV
jgi:hypothetical protein